MKIEIENTIKQFPTPAVISGTHDAFLCHAYGISQARILEWVTISFSQGSSQPRDQNLRLSYLLHWQEDFLPLSHLGSLVIWGVWIY